MTLAIISQIEVLIVRNSVRASFPKPCLSKSTSRFPFVTRLAQPATMNDIARVVINALMRKAVVTSPFARPTRRPDADAEQDRHDRVQC